MLIEAWPALVYNFAIVYDVVEKNTTRRREDGAALSSKNI